MASLRRHKLNKRFEAALNNADSAWKANLKAWREFDFYEDADDGNKQLAVAAKELNTMSLKIGKMIVETQEIMDNENLS